MIIGVSGVIEKNETWPIFSVARLGGWTKFDSALSCDRLAGVGGARCLALRCICFNFL